MIIVLTSCVDKIYMKTTNHMICTKNTIYKYLYFAKYGLPEK